MLQILKRYVLKEVTIPFLLGVVFFTFVILSNQLFRRSEILITYGFKWGYLLKLIFYLLPSILIFIAPMAFLVAILIGFGRLAADNEILAMRASGVSMAYIIRPMLVVSLFLSLGLLMMNWSVLPRVNLRVVDTLYMLQFNALINLKPGRFYDEFETDNVDITLYFSNRTVDVENESGHPGSDQTLGGVNLKVSATEEAYLTKKQEDDDPAPTEREEYLKVDPETGLSAQMEKMKTVLIVSNKGKIEAIRSDKSIRFTLSEGSIQLLDRSKPDENAIIKFDKFVKYIRPEIVKTVNGKYVKSRNEMSMSELHRGMKSTDFTIKDRRQFSNEFYQRISLPFSCLAFALLGIPLAIIIRPSSKAFGFALSFILILVYFLLLKWGTSLGDAGHPLAPLAILSPNLVLSVLGMGLLFKASRL
jgi:lipopolysaccharide export system permease protein